MKKAQTGNFLLLVAVFLWSVLFSGGLRKAELCLCSGLAGATGMDRTATKRSD